MTRLMEIVVHSDDLAASVGLPTPEFSEPVVRCRARPAHGGRRRPARPDGGACGRSAVRSGRRTRCRRSDADATTRTSGRRTTRCPTASRRSASGRGRGRGPEGDAVRRRAARATATGATSSTATATGRSRRSGPTSTPGGTTSTSRSRTGSTTSTSAPSSGPPTRSSPPRCTSSGNRRWNRRGAMVTDRYQHIRHHPTPADLAAYLHERDVVPARHRQPARLGPPRDDDDAAAGLLPVRPGRAGAVRRPAREVCDGTFSIAQFGSTRSINASAAAAIAMHTWIREYADLSGDDAWRG